MAERLAKCPVRVACSRLITNSGRSAVTVSRHLPAPSPRRPVNPLPPFSSARAVSVSSPLRGQRDSHRPPRRLPALVVTPRDDHLDRLAVGFAKRSRLTFAVLLPG